MRVFKAALGLVAVSILGTSSVKATVVDLTTQGSSGQINGATFLEGSTQPAGVGVFEPFLRLQANGSEQGLNTDAQPFPFDDKNSANWTHSVLLTDVGVVNYQGTNYREFGLDINQSNSGGNALLSLTDLKLFVANSPSISTLAALGNPVYDLNAGKGNNSVLLTGALNPGLGHSNMIALIPDSDFANPSGQYLYLYCKFTNASGGFEQWNFSAASCPAVPEPSSIAITALGLVAFGGMRHLRSPRRRPV